MHFHEISELNPGISMKSRSLLRFSVKIANGKPFLIAIFEEKERVVIQFSHIDVTLPLPVGFAQSKGVIMKKKLRSYQEKLLEDLRDPELAYHYLNEALIDEDPRMFLLALKNVREATQQSKRHSAA